MSKWDSKLSIIEDMAGKYTAEEIASAIDTTVNNLHKICHRNSISLPRPDSYNKKTLSSLTIDDAINFLIEKGYRVYKPDII
jgi:hypothetical protein